MENKQIQTVSLTNLAGFELSQRAAKLLASSTLVPKSYQNNLADCVVALNMAARMGADPLMIMQNLVIVHGRPSWSSQFLIATVNSCGRFSALRYEFSGAGDDLGCVAFATERETGEILRGSLITIALAKKEGWFSKTGSKWQTMPEQMLRYRAGAWWARAYAPELSMGLHTSDEIADSFDAKKDDSGAFVVEAAPAPAPAASPAPAFLSPEDFDKKSTAWRRAVESGAKTTADLIAIIESKTALTEEQKATINSWSVE